jgi:RNA polymerase-binding protein DksA
MNKADFEKYRAILINEQQAIRAEIASETSRLQVYPVANPDSFDLADKGAYQDGVSARLKLLKKRISLVEAAIKRLNEGTYGICRKCGNPINPERLEILPYAEYCIQCKSRIKV